MRVLHAIHDFLPRHAAGSEIYAFHLCRELAKRHIVHALAAEYDPARAHGRLAWRVHEGLPVIELVNNWEGSFADTWQSARLAAQLDQVLRATQPDVLHIHSLLNLSFDLPRLARARGVAVAATLHDHSLACPAGGQRLHLVDRTVCHEIEPDRCAACFPHSPFHAQLSVGAMSRAAGRGGPVAAGAAMWMAKRLPGAAGFFRRRVLPRAQPIPAADIERRLERLRAVFDAVQLFVAPSRSVADAHERLGLHRSKLLVSDYGFVHRPPAPSELDRASRVEGLRPTGGAKPERARLSDAARRDTLSPLRIGFVGTLVWHKGLHVLLDAARSLPAGAYEIEAWGSPDTFPDYTARLTAMARDLPVRFCGAFHNGQGADVYDRLDLLVVPSLWPENSPLVIHEAFMARVPVVAARIGGIPELVADGVNGLLYDPSSADALADALRALILMPERLREMGARAPSVKTIEEDARDWERRYQSLVQETGGGSSTRAGGEVRPLSAGDETGPA
jgi:glycosyltransferase involved in cell wall biosynthesis